MKRHDVLVGVAFGAVVFFCAGAALTARILVSCFLPRGIQAELSSLKDRRGLECEREFGFALGGPVLHGALWAGSIASGEQIRIQGVERVELAVCSLAETGAPDPARGPRPASDERPVLVRVRDRDVDLEVVLDERTGDESRVTLIAREGRQLVLARIEGDVEQIMRASLRPRLRRELRLASPSSFREAE